MWVKVSEIEKCGQNRAIKNAAKIYKFFRENLSSKSAAAKRKAINRFKKSLTLIKEKVRLFRNINVEI